jgi:integrase
VFGLDGEESVYPLLDPVLDRGSPTAANRALACMRKMFNWAEDRGVIELSPCNRIAKPAKEIPRERALDVVELQTFLGCLADLPITPTVQRGLLLCLLTAQRSGEIVSMRWQDLDPAWTWWTIPAERAKNGRSHRVPLTPATVRLLRQAKQEAGASAWVFPSARGDVPIRQTSLARALARNHEAMGVAPFCVHDLRRTAATHMTSLGIARLVVSKLLNHTDSSVTARYDRNSYDAEKRAAVETWEAQLRMFGFEANSSMAGSSGRGDAGVSHGGARPGGRRRVRRYGRKAASGSQRASGVQPERGGRAWTPAR